MFEKILIANRGEIACRIIATARRMGVATVAVYSDADRAARHVALADEAVRLGTGPASDSYLVIARIVEAARATGAQAIHPGYGFLAENPAFAAACRETGIVFIGPSPEAMEKLGGKAEAKRIAQAAAVPVVPGYQGDVQDPEQLEVEAGRVGYPVMIKAVSGGGGRGMRLVESAGGFAAALDSATREAAAAFGDARVLIEKYVVRPRHVEVQIFGDSHGNAVHLFERDCTLQRRNQKVIEEAPAPGMSVELRDQMTRAAVELARSVGYEGAGTVEFLVEGGALTADAPWYFIEMNTRLQVEHPVTEAITGLDLVEWQLRVAAGERLPLTQDQIHMTGHAIEARLCAEDPARGFAPSIGTIHRFDVPQAQGLRLETGVTDGSEISPYYDSLIAKLIVTAPHRAAALEGLAEALRRTLVLGLQTNAAFLHALVTNPDVVAAEMTTGLIAERIDRLVDGSAPGPQAIAAGIAELLVRQASMRHGPDRCERHDPWNAGDAFQLGGEPRLLQRPILVNGELRDVTLEWQGEHTFAHFAAVGDAGDVVRQLVHGDGPTAYAPDDRTAFVLDDMRHIRVEWPAYDAERGGAETDPGAIRAPINGRVAKIYVSEGDKVEENQPVAIVEAMKMEHVLASPRDGVIERVAQREGDQISEGTLIAALAAEDDE
jgi:3-methylcrotonyl-CoA carboxylase alpha subunit